MNGLAFRLVAAAAFTVATVAPASATVLVDNVTAPFSSINMSGLFTASEFQLGADVIVSEIQFISVSRFGGVLTEVQWAIYDGNPYFGGARLGGATVAPTGNFLPPGPESQRYLNRLAVPNLSLAAGTYWLELGNGVMNDFTRAIGELGSNQPDTWLRFDGDTNAFRIQDIGGGSINFQVIGSVVPEPASWAMMIAGFGLIGLVARRRRTGGVLA